VQEDFRGRICALWARRSEDRGKGLHAFLSHHLLNGGDEAELVGYVKHTLIASLRERPCLVPAPLQPVVLNQIEVGALIHELEDWVTAKELAVKERLSEDVLAIATAQATGILEGLADKASAESGGVGELAGPAGQVEAKDDKEPTYPVIARICYCMWQTGSNDHQILQMTSANRLANRYGKSCKRAAESLKKESDRFHKEAGYKFLLMGANMRDSHGRKMWSAVRDELNRRGETAAANYAQGMLDKVGA
jgi:hypothetical protein